MKFFSYSLITIRLENQVIKDFIGDLHRMSVVNKYKDLLECKEQEQEDKLNDLIDSCEDFVLVDE